MIKVLVVDDHSIMRDGLKTILQARGDIEVVGAAENGRAAITMAASLRPDVIIMDIAMPDMNGIEATIAIRHKQKDVKVVMFSMHQSHEHVFQSIQAGATGYILKESAGSCVVDAVHSVMRGRTFFGEGIEDPNLFATKNDDQGPFYSLSVRERETLQLVVENNPNPVIAEKLGVSVNTVEVYRTRIMAKLGVTGVPALVLLALRHGIISQAESGIFVDRRATPRGGENLAHGFNDVLSVIMGHCSLAGLDKESAVESLAAIQAAAERGASLSKQILKPAEVTPEHKTQADMWAIVDKMTLTLQEATPKKACEGSEEEGTCFYADAGAFSEYVMDLIVNMAKAFGNDQGGLKVSLTRQDVLAKHQAKDREGKSIAPGSYACLEVTDGPGGSGGKWIAFEPFFSTKPAERSFGLSAVLSLLGQRKGSVLQVIDSEGLGKTLKVFLSDYGRSQTDIDWLDISLPPAKPWKGTLLLVEDEEAVRWITRSMLESFGFDVLEAENGKEGLILFKENAADIALVVTDIGMPVMDGYEMIGKLKKLKPELPIVIASGYHEFKIDTRMALDNVVAVIHKPFGADRLREVLKSTLAYSKSTAVYQGSLPLV